MNETEQALWRALVELDNAVRAMPAANPKPDLRPLFAHIDELAGHLPREGDPELLHFLHRKSYAKARARLEGRRAERGTCGKEPSGDSGKASSRG